MINKCSIKIIALFLAALVASTGLAFSGYESGCQCCCCASQNNQGATYQAQSCGPIPANCTNCTSNSNSTPVPPSATHVNSTGEGRSVDLAPVAGSWLAGSDSPCFSLAVKTILFAGDASIPLYLKNSSFLC